MKIISCLSALDKILFRVRPPPHEIDYVLLLSISKEINHEREIFKQTFAGYAT